MKMTNRVVSAVLVACLMMFGLGVLPGYGQTGGVTPDQISLDNLAAFQAPGNNWEVAGAVTMSLDQAGQVITEDGGGILLNTTAGSGASIASEMQHGDVEVQFDFMVEPGARAAVFLQGRYGIQLADSWGTNAVRASDAGGIVLRARSSSGSGSSGYRGVPPAMNVARAPGLWQHMRIIFEAPQFNDDGEKVQHAQFKRVYLNGVEVHQGIQLRGPTTGAPVQNEGAEGALVFTDGNGQVALRNIEFKHRTEQEVTLSDIRYSYYAEDVNSLDDLAGMTPNQVGASDSLSARLAESSRNFGLKFTGTLHAPSAGEYYFELESLGPSRLLIDQETVIDRRANPDDRTSPLGATVDLDSGEHKFVLSYTKQWHREGPFLALYVEGPSIPRHELTTAASFPPAPVHEPKLMLPEGEAIVLRSFLQHKGEKKLFAASVGDPSGVHYSLDLYEAGMLQIWKGDFMDMTPVWTGRGMERFSRKMDEPEPLGSVVELSGRPHLAVLESSAESWPDTMGSGYSFKGYQVDDAGRPTFQYELGDLRIDDRFVPRTENGQGLERTIEVEGQASGGAVWVRLVDAESIEDLGDGLFAVNDKSFYIQILSDQAQEPEIRRRNGRIELLVPVAENGGERRLQYSIIW